MKKLYLILLFPFVLFGQSDNLYYILQNNYDQMEFSYSMILYDLDTNEILQTYTELIFEDEYGNQDYTHHPIFLSYVPNQQTLLTTTDYLFLRPAGGENGLSTTLLSYNNFDEAGTPLNLIGETTFDDIRYYENKPFGLVGLKSNSANYIAATLNRLDEYTSINLHRIGEVFHDEIILPVAYFQSAFDFGIAYKPSSQDLYFMVKYQQEPFKLHKYNLSTSQFEVFDINFNGFPNSGYYAKHYLLNEDKILMVYNPTGDFYKYDLQTNSIEFYKESDLENVIGIVSAKDYMSNAEVYNRGKINIYPNPVKDFLHIKSDKNVEKVEVFNIIGQKVKAYKAVENSISMQDISTGVYVLKITLNDGFVETKKIFKQ